MAPDTQHSLPAIGSGVMVAMKMMTAWGQVIDVEQAATWRSPTKISVKYPGGVRG